MLGWESYLDVEALSWLLPASSEARKKTRGGDGGDGGDGGGDGGGGEFKTFEGYVRQSQKLGVFPFRLGCITSRVTQP